MTDRLTASQILQQISENWPEVETPETGIMLGLIRLNDIVSESTAKVIARQGLTQAGFEVLMTLRAQAKPRMLTPTDLYRSLLITSGGMTKVLKQLEQENLIERLENPHDQRSKFVKLTEAGSLRAESAMADVSGNDKKILSRAFDPEQISTLKNTLLHALSALETASNSGND